MKSNARIKGVLRWLVLSGTSSNGQPLKVGQRSEIWQGL